MPPIEGLPDDIKDNAALQDFNDPGSLAKAYLDTKQMVGNSIRIPGPDAGEEDRTAFVNKLIDTAPNLMVKPNFDDEAATKDFFRTIGVPESAEKYSKVEFKDLPEGVEISDEQVQSLAKIAHENHLTDKQFQQVLAGYGAQVGATLGGVVEAQKVGMEELKTEWGLAFDDRLKQAVDILEQTGAPDYLKEEAKNGTIDPNTLRWAHSIHKAIGDETIGELGGNTSDSSSNGKLSPDEAQQRVDEIYANKDHPFWQNSSPGHAAAVNRMVELQGMINPSASTDRDFFRAGATS